MQLLAPIFVADLFPEEREALLDLLGSLSDAHWAMPTVCPGWSVHDVALHLLGADIGILSRRRDGYRPVATPRGDSSQWAELVAWLNRQNEAWIQATRRISPRLLRELLSVTGQATATHFARLDQYATGGSVNWVGAAPAPVWLDTAREYMERWVHQQHIRDAVGQPGLKERRWFAPVLATCVRALPLTLRHVEAPDGTCVRLRIVGDAGGEWFAVRTGQAWVLSAHADSSLQAAITLDQETAWRLFTKGLSKEGAMPRVKVEGDPALAGTMLDMVAIIA